MSDKIVDSIVPVSDQELSFDFNATHNGLQCIESLNPEDRGTERQFWFTRQMLAELFDIHRDSVTNNVDALVKRGAIADTKNFVSAPIPSDSGAKHATLYDLKVFNLLVMRLDTDKAWEMKEKFNDVLVKAETGCIRTVEDMINNPDTAIQLLSQIKSLRQQNTQLALERDEAIRTKSMIGSNREATAMATASAKSRECKRLTTENEELKDAVGRGMNWRTVSMMKAEWKREFGHEPSWQKLKKFSADLPTEMQPIKDVDEKVILKNGSEKLSKVNRYHIEAWDRYRQYEETVRVTGTETENV